jgi:large subunit ribosomal protein L6
MSRIGNNPVRIPKGVTVNVAGDKISVKGPKGALDLVRNRHVQAKVEGEEIKFTRDGDAPEQRAAHGLMRALVANMVTGVTQGFERKLEINGVGYRAEVKGKTLELLLGYSHPIQYPLPTGITAAVDKNILTLAGIDKQLLGLTAAKVRSFRPPEPYKGKGIKYVEEKILRKVGKAAG